MLVTNLWVNMGYFFDQVAKWDHSISWKTSSFLIFSGGIEVTLTKNGLNFVARNFQVRREHKLSTYKKQLWIQSIYFF